MIDATLLFEGMTVFSPWFPRQGDMLRVTAECIAANNTSVEIELYTKNANEPGDGEPVDASTSITLSSPGRVTQEWITVANEEGVEQMLRFRFVMSDNQSNYWILFRVLPAVWFDAVFPSVGPA